MLEMEKRMENKEREEKRRNVVMRGVEVREGKRREAVEEVMKIIGAKAEIKEVRRIGERREEGREMLLVKLENEEQKWDIMEKKRNLRGRPERISEDLTWKERKIKWKLGEIARGEEEKGRKAWIKGGRIRIEGK
ncbi:PREDICTED: uncharacterized protein LOC105560291 [Vollenhovia emeryi]|uniref:uncharacterized protein LOC105560291 n=1 Tax=Vollenhovia emeryi TaxID=411798 RepID=UPI0005F3E58F|nr:PREDICTED: uncharacterized protein LOC105560291 [Vollenhovia emeryi]